MPRQAAPARRAPAKRAPARRAPAVRRVAVARPKATPVRAAFNRAGTSAVGSAVGTALGGALGGPTGAMIGNVAGGIGGRMISQIFGNGDYRVTNAGQLRSNNIVLSNAANAPQFGGVGKVAVKLQHREYLGDVISSHTAGAFSIKDYAINPGIVETFPWMSQVVGSSFQQYRINGMMFEFRSMSSDALNSTNTQLGTVIMATDYDSKDVPFTSKQQMENTEYGVSCKPSLSMVHGIECARSQTPVSELYVRAWAVPSGADIRMYDLGRFSIATTGCQGTDVNLGELWVTYDVDVFKAIEQVPLYIAPFAEYNLLGAGNTAPMGAADTQVEVVDRIGLTFTENKVQWPADIQVGSKWQVYWELDGASTASVTSPVQTFGNGMTNRTNEIFRPNTTATTTTAACGCVCEYLGGGTPAALPYWNIADGTFPATPTYRAMSVYQVSGGITLPSGV